MTAEQTVPGEGTSATIDPADVPAGNDAELLGLIDRLAELLGKGPNGRHVVRVEIALLLVAVAERPDDLAPDPNGRCDDRLNLRLSDRGGGFGLFGDDLLARADEHRLARSHHLS